MLRAFFTAVYFIVFLFLIDLLFRHTLTAVANMLAIACWIIAFIASIGPAQFTVGKIREYYRRNPQ